MMFKTAVTALRTFFVFTVLCGIAYPLVVQMAAKLAYLELSAGDIIYREEVAIGARQIGVYTKDARYFWPRPSATTPPYNIAASGSSQAVLLDPAYQKVVGDRIAKMQQAHPYFKDAIPVDMVTASASGLDPHISPDAALMQAARVAKARKQPLPEVQQLVRLHIQDKQFGVLGQPRVNVQELNLALDAPRP